MGAAVDKSMHDTRLIAIDDDGGLAKIGGAKIARTSDLGIEREKAPGLAAKDMILFLLIELGIVIKPIRYPAIIERGPDCSGRHRRPHGAEELSSCAILGQGSRLSQELWSDGPAPSQLNVRIAPTFVEQGLTARLRRGRTPEARVGISNPACRGAPSGGGLFVADVPRQKEAG